MTQEDNNASDNFLTIFLIIAVVLVIITFAFPFVINTYFSDWSVSGTFGDTFGALNALFSGLAFTGVIVTILIQRTELKNQRIELQLQRTEMQETRKEFLINRTTNLVYNQLDRFEKSISEFQITHNSKTYIGNDAITFLDENKKTVTKPYDKPDEVYAKEMKESVIELLKIYTPNKLQIEKFAQNAFNSVEVLKRLIYKTDLDLEQLKDMKNIFFVNVGFINMGIIERMSELAEEEITYLETQDYIENGLDVGRMTRANIFLKSIKKFYQLRLTENNFQLEKAKWIDSVGYQA
jgi:hypothetical protein